MTELELIGSAIPCRELDGRAVSLSQWFQPWKEAMSNTDFCEGTAAYTLLIMGYATRKDGKPPGGMGGGPEWPDRNRNLTQDKTTRLVFLVYLESANETFVFL
jgi:hypothetical protein